MNVQGIGQQLGSMRLTPPFLVAFILDTWGDLQQKRNNLKTVGRAFVSKSNKVCFLIDQIKLSYCFLFSSQFGQNLSVDVVHSIIQHQKGVQSVLIADSRGMNSYNIDTAASGSFDTP